MTVNEAYIEAEKMIETAKKKAAILILQAKCEDLARHAEAFRKFTEKHGYIERRDERDFAKDVRGNWRHMKVYTAKDGANFYEVTDYPASDRGLRVEYWSDDDRSAIVYL